MTLAKHLDDAVTRMKNASTRIEQARQEPASDESLRYWLIALSDFCVALSDIQAFNNESVHEKLRELAERTHVKAVTPQGGTRAGS
jgi:hypothetical protein